MYKSFNEFYPDECCRGESPTCACACPFHVDVRDFNNKFARGNLDAAFKTFRNAVVFPRIVAALCPQPCAAACVRFDIDEAIDLLALERAAVTHARSLDPINFNVPVKKETIAVIGAGISGLACALRLASKKYQVTVFEKTDRIGGHLWDKLDEEVFLDDIATQGKYSSYELVFNREIKSLDELKDFDAVYIATGKGGNDFGLSADEDGNPQNGPKGVFIGGRVLGTETIYDIAQGAEAAINIEKHLKTGAMEFQPEKPSETRLHVYTKGVEKQPRVKAAGDIYTKEEAMAEANRCLRCDCSRCNDTCEFLQYYRIYPRQVANFTAFGLADMNLEPKSHNRMVNSCTDCGVCGEVCPFDIDNGSEMLAARRQMFESKKIPPAYHDYWIRDMRHGSGAEAALYFPRPEGEEAKYLFFPGCQLGASAAAYPKAAYDLLCRVEAATAALITCCGAPALWAGDAGLHQQNVEQIREQWQNAGKPTLVCACLTCLRLLRQFIPEMDSVSLYDVLAEAEDLSLPDYQSREEFALVDPCAAKFDDTARQSITRLLERMNVPHEALYEDLDEMPCCSFGGNIVGANPELAKIMRRNRVEADPRSYIAYCANCRDIFSGEGKATVHILDLLEGYADADKKRLPPRLSDRRANRIKARALFTNEEIIMEEPKIKLVYSQEIAERMDENLIFDEDVRQVIEHAERTDSKFIDEDGNSIGHLVIGLPTIWVEYRKIGEDEYEVKNCYMHRMTVVEPEREQGKPQ